MPLPPIPTTGYTGSGQLFTIGGKIIVVGGKLAASVRCCCEPTGCAVCDAGTTPGTLTLEFTSNPNIGGSGAGCAVNCGDWVNSWPMPLLTQAQLDSLWASYPFMFSDYPYVPPTAGCWYGKLTGLPCGTAALVAEIIASGMGDLQVGVRYCDALGNVGTLTYTCTGRDCLAVIDGTAKTVGVGGGTASCNWLGAAFSAITKITAS